MKNTYKSEMFTSTKDQNLLPLKGRANSEFAHNWTSVVFFQNWFGKGYEQTSLGMELKIRIFTSDQSCIPYKLLT